jgi:Arc/MetJ-type ribon-helix-helix transcriptional regulator
LWLRIREYFVSTAIEVALPDELATKARQFVEEGWVTDFDSLIAEALRRYLESHEPELTDAFLREDVEWGLHGQS